MARVLTKDSFSVYPVLTENAQKFVTLETMEALTGNPCFSAMFHLKSQTLYPHIALSKKADMLIIAPATANFLAKAALGIADDLLSTLFLTCTCPKLIAPAMNEKMLLAQQNQDNIQKLKENGVVVMPTGKGDLACGDKGAGRMAETQMIKKAIKKILKKYE